MMRRTQSQTIRLWPAICAGAVIVGVAANAAFASDTPLIQQVVSLASTIRGAAHAVTRVAVQGTAVLPVNGANPASPVLAASPEGEARDPALSMGTLPNGMRYYIRVNKNPAKRVELRLAINAGSLQEDDDQLGYAHFLEHMAFNGTTHFPGNKLIDFVEKSGMNFGADLNAYTSFDETVYMLTLPTDDPSILENGLQIFQDWASGGITLDTGEVLAERGVVLGEWRTRMMDTANENYMRHQDSVLFGLGSRYHTRRPIGTPESIEKATRPPLFQFYRDWYRPDLMAIVAVGDFDKAQMEREIKRRFGSIPTRKNPRPRPDSKLDPVTQPVVDVYRGNVYPSVTMLWSAPPRPTATSAAMRKRLVEQLVFEDVQRTFLKMRTQDRRPFYAAGIGRSGFVRGGGDLYTMNVVAWPDSLERGLSVALSEIERVAQHGIPASILERSKRSLLRRFERAAEGERADPSRVLASAYVDHYLTGHGVLLSSAQALKAAQTMLPMITSNELAEYARFWRDSSSLRIMYQMPKFSHVRVPTRASLLALKDSVMAEPVVARTDSVLNVDAPLMTTLPTPGTVVSERTYAKAGITEWTLSNGARVLYKPTTFNPDEFYISALSQGGTSLLPDSLAFSPGRLVGTLMTAAGGLGNNSSEQLNHQRDLLGLSPVHVALNFTDESVNLGGSPRHLAALFQQLYLQFTAPKLDTAAVTMWKRYGFETLTQSVNDQLAQTFSNGNARLLPPSLTLVPLVDAAQAMRIYNDRFGDASDFTFTVVGAATPDRVKPLVEQYIATLPSTNRTTREQAKSANVAPWFGISIETPRVLNVPKTSTFLTFDGLFPSTPDQYLVERQRLAAVARVLSRRLRNELREHLGGTYGVGVNSMVYASPEEHFRMMIQFDADPRRADTLTRALFSILDSVRLQGATADELATIATIQRRNMETLLESNSYWLNAIQGYDRLSISFDRITDPYTKTLTADDVSAAARKYLPKSSYVQITYLPIDTTYKIKKLPGDQSATK